MRALVALFNEKNVRDAVEAKRKKKQSVNEVGKDFEDVIDGKKIKLYLPKDVKDQYRLVLLTEDFFALDRVLGYDSVLNVRFQMLDAIVKHCLIDGEVINDVNQIPFNLVDTLIFLYITEILYPLYLGSITKVKEAVTKTLNVVVAESFPN